LLIKQDLRNYCTIVVAPKSPLLFSKGHKNESEGGEEGLCRIKVGKMN
jgi:hypothetical protein